MLSIRQLSPQILLVTEIWSLLLVEGLDFLVEIPNFSDEILEPKYEIIIRQAVASAEYTAASEHLRSVITRDARGTEIACHLPELPKSSTDSPKEDQNVTSPSALLEGLGGLCLVKTQDWWTYDFCCKQQILQFHKEGNERVQQFNLGSFSSENSDTDEILYETGLTGTSAAYVREVYDGGSACEVKDIQRTTEVRYICSESGETAIKSVKEVHSCSYQVVVATPLICQHPAFQGVQDPVHEIVCHPTKDIQAEVNSQDPGRGATSNHDTAEQSSISDDATEAPVSNIRGGKSGVNDFSFDNLSDKAMDDLISSIIMNTASNDPDIDFLGLAEYEQDEDEDADVFEQTGAAIEDDSQQEFRKQPQELRNT